jgi:hypothetical protein
MVLSEVDPAVDVDPADVIVPRVGDRLALLVEPPVSGAACEPARLNRPISVAIPRAWWGRSVF